MSIKNIIIFFVILIILVIAFMFVQNYLKTHNISLFSRASATIRGHSFTLSVAASDKDKQIGLSEKASLGKDEGMLFSFSKPDYYPFWMKNMKFPIDIVYINNNHIVTIDANVQPPKTSSDPLPIILPDEPADTVVELSAGISETYHFQKGDEVKISK